MKVMIYNTVMKFCNFLGITFVIFSFLFTSCLSDPKTEPAQPVPEVEQKEETNSKNEEYKRSLGTLETEEEISFDTFEADKQAILSSVAQLADIMEKKSFKPWLNYITPESRAYWSNSANLKTATARMPIKQLQIRSLEDYFKYIFCPAREGKHIDEIRYISGSMVLAVQVAEDKDIIYYTFLKKDDKWLVELDKLK